MRSFSKSGFWSMPILTGFKISLVPQQTLKDFSSEQILLGIWSLLLTLAIHFPYHKLPATAHAQFLYF